MEERLDVCRKIPFASRKLAKKEIKRQRAIPVYLQGKKQRRAYLRAYECTNCQFWHLTSHK